MIHDKIIYYLVGLLLTISSTYSFISEYIRTTITIRQGSNFSDIAYFVFLFGMLIMMLCINVFIGFGLHVLTAYRKQNRWWEYIVFVAVLGWAFYVLYYVWFATPWD